MTLGGRATVLAASLFASVAVLGAIALDASRLRHAEARHGAALLAVAARLPSPDLALSGGARWLRVVALEGPSAAFDLGPAMLDPDPAGGLIAPPREVWVEQAPAGRLDVGGRAVTPREAE
jgi:hypothetical protein